MGEFTAKNVFETLDSAVKAHARFVEDELKKLQTAMLTFEAKVTRRIDELDTRMDDFRKRYGGPS